MQRQKLRHAFAHYVPWLALLIVAGGCNMIAAPIAILGQDQTRKVPAEYADLSGKTVCVWVWADQSLLFEYPQIRIDVANHARHFIRQNVKNVIFVDPVQVDRYQKTQYDAEVMPVAQVGQHFNADVVLFIQVSDFMTRSAGSPNLYQGRIQALCALYDCSGDLPITSTNRKLWSAQVNVVYPESPLGMVEANDLVIRSALLKQFGEALARYFYKHRVPV